MPGRASGLNYPLPNLLIGQLGPLYFDTVGLVYFGICNCGFHVALRWEWDWGFAIFDWITQLAGWTFLDALLCVHVCVCECMYVCMPECLFDYLSHSPHIMWLPFFQALKGDNDAQLFFCDDAERDFWVKNLDWALACSLHTDHCSCLLPPV